jgi:LPS sulfotransferase NodH
VEFRRRGLSRRVLLARQRRRLRKGLGTTSQREFLVEVLRRGAIPNRVFGATVMWTYIEEMLDLVSVATGRVGLPHEVLRHAFRGLHYVHLMRRDRVAQAVSWVKAVQTDVWRHGDVGDPDAAEYDAEFIGNLVRLIDDSERYWVSLFAQSDELVYHVAYEDLAASPERTAMGVLAFLGVATADVEMAAPTPRQAAGENDAWVERFLAEHGG